MTILAALLIGWGSLNAVVMLVVFAGLARRRYDPGEHTISDRITPAGDSMPWV
jgi:hypothetical protein